MCGSRPRPVVLNHPDEDAHYFDRMGLTLALISPRAKARKERVIRGFG